LIWNTRAMDAREVQAFISLCRQFDIDCMVRAATRERSLLYRYLEDGAAGSCSPLSRPRRMPAAWLTTSSSAMGDRGSMVQAWMATLASRCEAGYTYTEHANTETFIVAQIETPKLCAM